MQILIFFISLLIMALIGYLLDYYGLPFKKTASIIVLTLIYGLSTSIYGVEAFRDWCKRNNYFK